MTQTGDEKKESYRKMLEIMGCPCQVIDRRGAEQPLEELYLEKREQGKRDGFVPLFIYPDENFIDMVTTNLAESSMEMPESLLGRFEDGKAAEHFQEDTEIRCHTGGDSGGPALEGAGLASLWRMEPVSGQRQNAGICKTVV